MIDYPVTWTDDDGDRIDIYATELTVRQGNNPVVVLPTDPAERRRLAEAILQRPILDIDPPREVADLIFVDELPEVEEYNDGAYRTGDRRHHVVSHSAPLYRDVYLAALAAQRAEEAASKMDDEIDPRLRAELHRLGDEWGPLGVAKVAAGLTDSAVLIEHLRGESE